MGDTITVRKLSAWFGNSLIIRDIDMMVESNKITAIIGPSGAGKSTYIRCINRMHEVVPGARTQGEVFVDEFNIYGPGVDPVAVRSHIGMVFQRPTPFPTMSIFDNVAAGPRLHGLRNKHALRELVERSLQQAALWDEVKDRLKEPATVLSGGQQQRLCIARGLAMRPGILLLDEPASALDPIATYKVEELLLQLKTQYTVMIVTHNMQQAARIADNTAFMMGNENRVGELVEFGPTDQIFSNPLDRRTEEYITGRFG